MQHQFSTDQPVQLFVELGKGSLTVQAVETTQTTVEVTGADAEAVAVVQSKQQITVVAPRHSFGKDRGIDVVVTLPLDSDLVTKTGSADTTARGRFALARLKSGSGDIELSETTGPVVVDIGSGDLHVETAGAELRVKSGSGDVRVGEVVGTMNVSTGSGNVGIGSASAPGTLKSGSGDLAIDRAGGDLRLVTASGDVVVGHIGSGGLQAKTASGDVRIGVPAGVPVWTDVRSVSGRIDSDLTGAGQPTEGQDHVELRATTASGDIVLHQL